MKNIILIITMLLFCNISLSQDEVYSYEDQNGNNTIINRIIKDNNYFIITSYEKNSNKFLKTIGGFYKKEGNKYIIDLEFNSNYKNDSISKVEMNYQSSWEKISLKENDLQGKWLMLGRVRDGKRQLRNLQRPRKTMKVLINGYFQWIAFNSETFQFSGSGGGKYLTENGKYIEQIEYFSRDNTRVGVSLDFDYIIKNEEWNHKGYSSKGDPMHEIWIKRK